MPAYQTLPFTKEDIPPRAEQDTEAILRSARVAGATLMELRERNGVSLERAAEWLVLSAEDLSRAEAGQFIEVTRRGRVIDIASTLLIMFALFLEREAITFDLGVLRNR